MQEAFQPFYLLPSPHLPFPPPSLSLLSSLSLLPSLRVDLESAEFAQHVEPFLHEKTGHFMHEFVSFAKSPFDMIAYDRRVRYEWPRSLRPPDNWDPEATQQQAPPPGRHTFSCRASVSLLPGCNLGVTSV